MPRIDMYDDFMDYVLEQYPSGAQIESKKAKLEYACEQTPVFVSHQGMVHSLFVGGFIITVCAAVIAGILLFSSMYLGVIGVVVLYVVLLVLLVIRIKMHTYYIYDNRVVHAHGFISRVRKSILFTKIDNIRFDQGVGNKMFRDGNISISTIGSSYPELILVNMPDFAEFYEKLQSMYR